MNARIRKQVGYYTVTSYILLPDVFRSSSPKQEDVASGSEVLGRRVDDWR